MRGPSVACPHVHAEDENLSSHKRALGHMNAEGGGNHSICVAFLAQAPWGFFISFFFFFSFVHEFGCRRSEVLDKWLR